jgi:hypothetical protein
LENVKVCASWESTEHESNVVVVDDDIVVGVAIDNALEESSVAGEESIFGCFSARVGPCPLSSVEPIASECEDITMIMALVM